MFKSNFRSIRWLIKIYNINMAFTGKIRQTR